MALVIFDGYDLYGTSPTMVLPKWTRQTNGALTTTNALTRFSAGGAAIFDARYFEYDFASPLGRIIVGGAYWPAVNSPSATVGLFSFWDAATQQCTFCLEPDGSLSLRRGSRTGTSVAASSAGVVAFNGSVKNYQYIEADITIHNTTGAITAHVEGGSVLTASSLNTRSSTNNSATTFRLGDAISPGFSTYVEDTYVLDTTGGSPLNAMLGDVRVYTLVPNGSGPSTQWTSSAGANYSAVDELPPDEDSTFVATSTPGNLDLYNVTDLPGTISTVYAVGVASRLRKDDTGVRQAAGAVRSSATDVAGTTRTLIGSYQTYWDPYSLDPNGGIAWTPASVNALKIGVKCIS